MKRIILNGRPHETAAEKVSDLVAELGLSTTTTLVEVNQVALRAGEWAQEIAEGDRVEILRIAAGG